MNCIRIASLLAIPVLLAMAGCEKKPAAEKLPAPVPVLASAGINNATVMWEKVKNAASYQVVVNDNAPLSTEGTTITIPDLSPSTSYTIKARALAPEGSSEWLDSDWSDPVAFSTAGKKALAKPVLTVSDVISSGFKVSWKAVRNAGSYVYKVGDAAEVETEETSFTADGLKHSTKYVVKVKAVPSAAQADFAVDSEWAETEVTTEGVATLDAPVLASSDVHTNGFTISWDAVPGAGKYNYKLNGGAVQATTNASVAFNDLTALTDYTVQVQAAPSDANAANYEPSEWSSIQVRTLDLVVLAAPQLKASDIKADSFVVSWAAVPNAGKYMCSIGDAAATATTGTSISYTGLTAETAYSVKVYAAPADAQTGTYKAGPASSITVTTKSAPSPDDKGGDLSDFTEKPIF
jgi:hypothetical protein